MRTLVMMIAALAAGCSSTSSGSIELRLSGEQAAVEGWPFVADGETIAFADGWEVRVDRVLVSITGVHLRARDGDDADLALEPIVADLHGGDVQGWREDGVAARRWDDVGYTMATPPAGARLVGGAREDDVARMRERGWSLLFEGTATHAEHGTVTIELGMPETVLSERCQADDGTDGIVVPPSSTAVGQLTFHLDHLFFDSLTDDAAMRFTAWAAAAGDDGRVTLDDLASQPLADLRGLDGEPLRDASGELLFYDPGSAPLGSEDLRAFTIENVTTIGHWNGEGHCDYRRPD